MKLTRMVGVSIVAINMTAAGAAFAQQAPPTPRDDPASESAPPATVPPAPAEQFAPCAGITDQAERDACIRRETTKGNPATESIDEAPKNPPEKPE